MWCILYIAIAGAAPPTDCSIISEEMCRISAAIVNDAEWQENESEISHLALCVSANKRALYLQARLVERVSQ